VNSYIRSPFAITTNTAPAAVTSPLNEQEQQHVAVGPETAVIHFWSSGGVRRGSQDAANLLIKS